MTEAQEQATLIKWSMAVREQYPELKLLYHIPNGGARDSIEGKHLKAQGVKKGVPDLHLPVPRGNAHGLYIELKKKGGRVSPEQLWWMEELLKQGYEASICYGWQEASETIRRYLDGESG